MITMALRLVVGKSWSDNKISPTYFSNGYHQSYLVITWFASTSWKIVGKISIWLFIMQDGKLLNKNKYDTKNDQVKERDFLIHFVIRGWLTLTLNWEVHLSYHSSSQSLSREGNVLSFEKMNKNEIAPREFIKLGYFFSRELLNCIIIYFVNIMLPKK